MTVELKGKKFDLTQIEKYYPAVIMEYDDGQTTEISFEWLDTNTKPLNEVKVLHFMLIIYIDIANGKKIEIPFENRQELFEVVNEIGIVLDRLKESIKKV